MTTKRRGPSLAEMYHQLLTRAKAHPGEWQRINLSRGAALMVQIAEERGTLIVSRIGKRIGDAELIVFEQVCKLPAGHLREPEDRTMQYHNQAAADGLERWFVRYTWRVET